MLVLDNSTDQAFLGKVLERLEFNVISMKKGVDLSEQLLDHFPEIVFASTLGKNEKILSGLAKIKAVRGKPMIVVVRQEKESAALNQEQRSIIDGVLYSPIDPFKLIDLMVNLTGRDIVELRHKYNEGLLKDKPEPPPIDYGITTVVGKQTRPPEMVYVGGVVAPKEELEDDPNFADEENAEDEESRSFNMEPTPSRSIIFDESRKKKYNQICSELGKEKSPQKILDTKKLRDMQRKQSEKIQESPIVKENRSQFLQALFTMKPVIKRK